MNATTLWIGLVGIVLATISLTWQAVTFRLTGGRVVAHLRVGVDAAGSFITHEADKDWMRHILDIAAGNPGPPNASQQRRVALLVVAYAVEEQSRGSPESTTLLVEGLERWRPFKSRAMRIRRASELEA